MGAGNQGQRPVTDSPFFGMLPPDLWGRTKDHFVYAIDFLALPAAVTTPGQIAIQADSDFYIAQQTGFVWSNANADLPHPWPITVMVIDAASGRNFYNQPVPIGNFFPGPTAAVDAQPFFPTLGKLVRANSTLTIQLTNLTAATTFNVRIQFIGFKCFLGY